MEIMSRETLGDSRLGTIMLKFRPIAPKPPSIGTISSAGSDRAGIGPMIKRRRSRAGRKLNRTAAAAKKETGALVSPLPTALVAVERVTAVGRCAASGEDIKRRLEAEEAPCFVSDDTDRITWINAAFCKMVICEDSSSSSSSLSSPAPRRMELVTRGMVPGGECGGFTCVARVRRGKAMMVVPCDVWRVAEEGKWAWRLDVATALGLGLSCAY